MSFLYLMLDVNKYSLHIVQRKNLAERGDYVPEKCCVG